jgi:hypothetical protein
MNSRREDDAGLDMAVRTLHTRGSFQGEEKSQGDESITSEDFLAARRREKTQK